MSGSSLQTAIVNVLIKGCLVFSVLFLGSSIGCDSQTANNHTQQDGQSKPTFVDNLSADQIFSQMLKKYRAADGYSDRAVLYMSYRLNGRRIQEPQPWAIAINSQGGFSANLFNAQIRCDGQIFSCYVYDIESGNLDDQRVVIPVKDHLPIEEIYNDDIARHFISGYAEMPLDEARKSLGPDLVPPTVGLLTGAMPPKWLKPDVRLERFEDSNVDGRDCFVVRCFQSRMTDDHVDLWIDKESAIVWQASLPTSCLDPKVRNSPEIVDLRMVARFHEAKFVSDRSADHFALKSRPNATPVSRFVKVPEPLLSELIGMKAPKFELKTQSGKPITSEQLAGRPTVLLWVAGDMEEAVSQLDYLKHSLPKDIATTAAVYSDRDLASAESESLAMNMELNAIARKTNINFLYDKDMTVSTLLGVQAVPSVLVLGKDMSVQYTTSLAQGWAKEAKAAVERVAAGEDVATEMLADYQDFLEAYHQQLLTVSTANLIDARAEDSKFKLVAGAKATGRIVPTKTWTNSAFKLAGNVFVVANQTAPRIFAFDGWRSIVELDKNGNTIDRQELDLPTSDGVSVLRVASIPGDKLQFAAFMPNGKKVHVFDDRWNRLLSYPKNITDTISDAEYLSPTMLTVATKTGLHAVDIKTKTGKNIDNTVFDSVSQSMANISDGQLLNPESDDAYNAIAPWQVTRLKQSGAKDLLLLGSAKDGGWFALRLLDGKLDWSSTIGSQLFNRTIEPIAVTQGADPVWAIANANNGIHLFSDDGTWLGDFQSDTEINGVSLLKTDGQLQLLLSTSKGVTNWKIEIKGPSNTRAASHRN